MKRRWLWAIAVVLFMSGCVFIFPPIPYHGDLNPGYPLPAKPDSAMRLAFGSCDNQRLDQHIWKPIVASKPDVWLWLGDMIYADTEDMDEMKAMYDRQKNSDGYTTLRSTARIIGIYDDHDLGANNVDKYYPKKKESQALALDFLDEPADSPRRSQEGDYISYTWTVRGRSVQLILLDTRYHRDPPGPESDLLGERQWVWLEQQLNLHPPPDLTLIGSGVQVFREDFWKEKWHDYPKSKTRLLQLLKACGRNGLVLLSGDRHHAELSVLKNFLPYPLYEVTSSGLTHYKGALWYLTGQERNAYRVGKPLGALNFGILDMYGTADGMTADIYLCDDKGMVRIEKRLNFSSLPPP